MSMATQAALPEAEISPIRQRPKRKSAKKAEESLLASSDEDEFDRVEKMEYDILDIIQSGKFLPGNVRELESQAFTHSYIRQCGFREPMRFKEGTNLGMVMPASSFTVADVESYVGSNRVLDVMDCATQMGEQMTMQDWVRYYNDPNKDRLLNVITLEISQSKLSPLVKAPELVRQIDWIDLVWPPQLKRRQNSQTNSIQHMKYPKVQKYCLMSVGGCYTDFHIDFGGSSVWYHVLRGTKIFFLVEPTAANIKKFEKWSRAQQGSRFFGDDVEVCSMLTLTAGHTFMIPTGWIHAVYTPEDSLVFGGNFLHGYDIIGQLGISKLESRLGVPNQYRFPFFQELMWYGALYYARLLQRHQNGASNETTAKPATNFETDGLKVLIPQLKIWADSPLFSKQVPPEITNPNDFLVQLTQFIDAMWTSPKPNLKTHGQESQPCLGIGMDMATEVLPGIGNIGIGMSIRMGMGMGVGMGSGLSLDYIQHPQSEFAQTQMLGQIPDLTANLPKQQIDQLPEIPTNSLLWGTTPPTTPPKAPMSLKSPRASSSKGQFHCSFPGCNSTLSSMWSLKRHHALIHDPVKKAEIQKSKEVICPFCQLALATSWNLRRHLGSKHRDHPKYEQAMKDAQPGGSNCPKAIKLSALTRKTTYGQPSSAQIPFSGLENSLPPPDHQFTEALAVKSEVPRFSLSAADVRVTKYCRLKVVRDGIKKIFPQYNAAQVTQCAANKWKALSDEAKQKFEQMFLKFELVAEHELKVKPVVTSTIERGTGVTVADSSVTFPPVLDCGSALFTQTPEVSATLDGDFHNEVKPELKAANSYEDRNSKYARPSYKAPADMIQRAKENKSRVLAAVSALNPGSQKSKNNSVDSKSRANVTQGPPPRVSKKKKLDAILASVGVGRHKESVSLVAKSSSSSYDSTAAITAANVEAKLVFKASNSPKQPEKKISKSCGAVDIDALYTLPGLSATPQGTTPVKHDIVVDHEKISRKQALANWIKLSQDLWNRVVLQLSDADKIRWGRTCRQFYQYSSNPDLWKAIQASRVSIMPIHVKRINDLKPQMLDLSWSEVSEQGLFQLLNGNERLTCLDLSGCKETNPLEAISTGKRRLTKLNLNFSPFTNDEFILKLCEIKELSSLTDLHIAGTAVTDRGVEQVLVTFPDLQVLDVYRCRGITNDAFAAAADHTPHLRQLDLRFTNATLDTLSNFKDCPKMETLDVRDCPSFANTFTEIMPQPKLHFTVVTS